jgi:hypothetical protein
MRIENRDVIARPIDEVYTLLRDDLPRLLPHVPNVSRIERVSATPTATGLSIVNHWFAIADVPGPAKRFLKPELFSWKDYAEWNDASRCVDYRLESFLGSRLYDATGRNSFFARGPDRTELHVACDVVIHADRIPGIPKLVLAGALPIVEKAIEQLIALNLRSIGKGVAAYFRAPGQVRRA